MAIEVVKKRVKFQLLQILKQTYHSKLNKSKGKIVTIKKVEICQTPILPHFNHCRSYKLYRYEKPQPLPP